jgi:hypothetical protein
MKSACGYNADTEVNTITKAQYFYDLNNLRRFGSIKFYETAVSVEEGSEHPNPNIDNGKNH